IAVVSTSLHLFFRSYTPVYPPPLHSFPTRRSSDLAAVPEVRPRGAPNADKIKASVLEESLVLGGKNGVHQGYRQVVVANPPVTRSEEHTSELQSPDPSRMPSSA